MSDEHDLRERLCQSYRTAAALGLNELSSGNLSCRVGPDDMLISPSGANAESISPAGIVQMSLDGEPEGSRVPSSEWQMHAAIYRAHPGAGAIVHTHSDHCVAVACHGRPLPGFHYLVGTFGGTDVPCVPYATFGTERLGASAAAALAERSACLLANHGMICRGPDLATAMNLAQLLELCCRQYLLACQLGEPRELSDLDWTEFFRQADTLGYHIVR